MADLGVVTCPLVGKGKGVEDIVVDRSDGVDAPVACVSEHDILSEDAVKVGVVVGIALVMMAFNGCSCDGTAAAVMVTVDSRVVAYRVVDGTDFLDGGDGIREDHGTPRCAGAAHRYFPRVVILAIVTAARHGNYLEDKHIRLSSVNPVLSPTKLHIDFSDIVQIFFVEEVEHH